MSLFRLEKEGDDMSSAELVIARETTLELENHLESWLENSPWALTQDEPIEPILWIGRQTRASVEEKTIIPDLLGVDSEGNLVIVELKKGREPRTVVAQLLEYAAWAAELLPEHIRQIAEKYFQTRGMSQGETFHDAFRETFELKKEEEVPLLNQRLRLFVVAEEISPRVLSICRFLRTTYRMDISCKVVSPFQTESGEMLVNIETKVGDENVVAPQAQRQSPSQWSGDKGTREVVWEAVQEITDGDATKEFTRKEVFDCIVKKYPDFEFKRKTVGGQILAACPNHQAYRGKYPYYWRVGTGRYRLYNSETDREERQGEREGE